MRKILQYIHRFIVIICTALCVVHFAHAQTPKQVPCSDGWYKIVGENVVMRKVCWDTIATEYNRCEEENETILPILFSLKKDTSIYAKKYRLIQAENKRYKAMQDSSSKDLANCSKIMANYKIDIENLKDKNIRLKQSRPWYVVGGAILAIAIIEGIKTVQH